MAWQVGMLLRCCFAACQPCSHAAHNTSLICRHSMHYNGGNVPLQVCFPFYGAGSD
jgi:hypothetical protein